MSEYKLFEKGAYKYSIEDMNKIALEKAGKCLSKDYKGYNTKLEWECSFGHKWMSDPKHIIRGNWCSMCNKNKRQEFCRYIFEKLSGYKFTMIRKKFEGYNNFLEIDGFNEELKIGFEYQGIQHYKITAFSKNNELLNNIKNRDIIKEKLLHRNDINVLYIKYDISDMDIINLIKEFLGKYVETKQVVINIDDFYKGYSYLKNKIEDIFHIIKNKNGQLLSYDLTKCEIKCCNGHVWKTKISIIKQGFWCRKCSDTKLVDSKELFNEKISNYGFILKEFIQNNVIIECSNGHIINMNKDKVNFIINSKRSLCNECLKSKTNYVSINNIKEMEEKCKLRFLNSNEYKNKKSIMIYKCLSCQMECKEPYRNIINRYKRTNKICKCKK